MMTLVAVLVFGGALALAVTTIALTVAPYMAQITDALYGRQPARFEPLAALVRAERRIAVRRWAAAPVARSGSFRTREAA